jgi:hypothetical protein
MATLVLSTVGTALGGPIGGAIGALIGQSFDQQLLAPASRGPRLGDLSVQSSSYGTQIPRIYGSMRVAGSVVWATDLVESEQTTGAKGQPDVTYGYSVSLAVALSSRLVGAIGRIWADGKLLRGAEGDFKVPVTFRFYDGSETQAIDPLVGSIEGIANTPAYRGLALAVFENLELANYGNRIPFMTFEVIADPEPPAISSILADASGGAIVTDSAEAVSGYAAYGRSVAAAVAPLVDCFDVALFDDGSVVRHATGGASVMLASDELGNSADGAKASKIQREQTPLRSVPSTLRLTYYDPDRDYQAGEARAIAGEHGSNEVQQELAAVLSAPDAKSLVERMLARQWAARDRLTLRLPPMRLGLEPGSIVEPGLAPGSWIVDTCTIDGFVVVAELRPSWQPSAALVAEAGRIVSNIDIVEAPMSLAVLDAPDLGAAQMEGPKVLIAASSATPGWGAQTLTVSGAGRAYTTQTPVRKSVLGTALTRLADAQPFLVDEAGSVDIHLVDEQQWLTSCDDNGLAEGLNLAVLGSELIQFGIATPIGPGRFRLTRLLRGRAGSEWASAGHAAGETFCLIDSGSVRALPLPAWMRGSEVIAADRDGSSASLTFGAQSARPLAPVKLSASIEPSGDLRLDWVRRSRAGYAWLDEVDAPLGESRERYRVNIAGASAALERTTDAPELVVGLADVLSLGAGPVTIEVRQVGDWAASLPAELTIDLFQE